MMRCRFQHIALSFNNLNIPGQSFNRKPIFLKNETGVADKSIIVFKNDFIRFMPGTIA